MSKTVSANLLTELASEAPNIATCWKIEREDGTILGFTDWAEPIIYGGLTYYSAGGYQRTAINQKEGLSVDNMDVIGLIDSSYITEDDLLSRKYHNAKVWIFIVSPNNIGWGDLKLDYGRLGEITVGKAHFTAEFRSLMTLVNQEFGNKYSRYCRHILGESLIVDNIETKCGIELEPAVWQASTAYTVGDAVSPSIYNGRRFVCTNEGTSNDTEGEPAWDTTIGNTTTETDGVEWECYDAYTKEGTVTSVVSDFKFIDTSFTDSDGWYQYGVLTWITGNNIGLRHDIKESLNTGSFTLKKPTIKTIEVGDTFKVSVGCNHILKMPGDVKGSPYTGDCRAKFNLENGGNAKQFGGEPELPNLDRVATPASSIS